MTRKERIEYGREIREVLDSHGITMETFKAVAIEISKIDEKYGVSEKKND